MAIGTKKVKVKGKTYTYPRDYKKEYSERSKKQKSNRSKRRRARTKMEKVYGKSALKGKDVDHKRGIGAGNGKKNLRIISVKANRSRKSTRWR